jgi:hypothetical protein
MKVMVLHVKMIKPCESSLGGVVWWKPTCAPKKWEP